jgi:hypothetical protein
MAASGKEDDVFFDAPDTLEQGLAPKDLQAKWFTITNLDTGEVIHIDQADSVIPPSPFTLPRSPTRESVSLPRLYPPVEVGSVVGTQSLSVWL